MATNIFDLRVKEDTTPYLKKIGSTKYAEETIDSPAAAAKMLCRAFGADRRLEEHVWEICLDVKAQPVALFEIAHGTISGAFISAANIYRRALLTSAARVIIAHNHPSGDVFPSVNDIDLTELTVAAGKALDIPLSDHIIIGRDGKYYSFLEHNKI